MKGFYPHVTDGIGILLVPLSILLTVYAKYVIVGWRRIVLAIISVFITTISFRRALSLAWGFEYWEGFDIIMLITSAYNAPFYLATSLIATASIITKMHHDFKRWFGDKKARQTTLDDIKMIFDGVKQIGLSVAIAYSLKLIQAPMRQDLKWEESTIGLVNCGYVLITVYLLILGYAWIGFSFKSKPASKLLHGASLLTFGGISLTILYYIIKTDYKDIAFNPWN